MAYVRFPKEVDYQAHLQRLLKRMQYTPYFSSADHHNYLEVVVFETAFGNLYWLPPITKW